MENTDQKLLMQTGVVGVVQEDGEPGVEYGQRLESICNDIHINAKPIDTIDFHVTASSNGRLTTILTYNYWATTEPAKD